MRNIVTEFLSSMVLGFLTGLVISCLIYLIVKYADWTPCIGPMCGG